MKKKLFKIIILLITLLCFPMARLTVDIIKTQNHFIGAIGWIGLFIMLWTLFGTWIVCIAARKAEVVK